jgi:hypothetical protein
VGRRRWSTPLPSVEVEFAPCTRPCPGVTYLILEGAGAGPEARTHEKIRLLQCVASSSHRSASAPEGNGIRDLDVNGSNGGLLAERGLPKVEVLAPPTPPNARSPILAPYDQYRRRHHRRSGLGARDDRYVVASSYGQKRLAAHLGNVNVLSRRPAEVTAKRLRTPSARQTKSLRKKE